MTMLRTNIGATRESARQIRFEPNSLVTSERNVQDAIDDLSAVVVGLAPGVAPVVHVTAPGDVVVTPTDGIISIEKAAPQVTQVTLPPSASRLEPVLVKDTNGVASAFPITIVPSPGETIDGGASLGLAVDFGAWQLSPTTNGWLIT